MRSAYLISPNRFCWFFCEVALITNFLFRWLQGRSTIFSLTGDLVRVLRGAPQGAPLSAIIFVVYFDFTLPDGTKFRSFIAYADDGSIIIYAESWFQVKTLINQSLREIEAWCELNQMEIALQKCFFIPIDDFKTLPKEPVNLPSIVTFQTLHIFGITECFV